MSEYITESAAPRLVSSMSRHSVHEFSGNIAVVHWLNIDPDFDGSEMQTEFGLGWLSEGLSVDISLTVPAHIGKLYGGANGEWYSFAEKGTIDWTLTGGGNVLTASTASFLNSEASYYGSQVTVWDNWLDDGNPRDRYTVNNHGTLNMADPTLYDYTYYGFEVSMWDPSAAYYNFAGADPISDWRADPAGMMPGADTLKWYLGDDSQYIYDATFLCSASLPWTSDVQPLRSVFMVGINFDRGSPPPSVPDASTTALLLGLGLVGLAGVGRKFDNKR